MMDNASNYDEEDFEEGFLDDICNSLSEHMGVHL